MNVSEDSEQQTSSVDNLDITLSRYEERCLKFHQLGELQNRPKTHGSMPLSPLEIPKSMIDGTKW